MLTLEMIKESDLRIIEPVSAHEFGEGEIIHVRAVTARERDEYEASRVKMTNKRKNPVQIDLSDVTAKAAVLGCCHPDGTPFFKPDDADWLSQKRCLAPFLARVKKKFDELNGFDAEGEEEYVKNSEAAETSFFG